MMRAGHASRASRSCAHEIDTAQHTATWRERTSAPPVLARSRPFETGTHSTGHKFECEWCPSNISTRSIQQRHELSAHSAQYRQL